MFFLADGDMAVLTMDGVNLSDFDGRPVNRQVTHVLWDPIPRRKGRVQALHAQGDLRAAARRPRHHARRVGLDNGQIFLDEMDITPADSRASARYESSPAAPVGTRVGRQVHDREAGGHPVEVDYGSEFRYRDPIVIPDSLTVVISQSGETADTLAAQREAKQKGSKTLAICNVVGSW